MPHVLRNPRGEIVALHREPVAGSEWLAADDAAVRAFLGDAQPDAAHDGFRQLDADLVRVIEDVVDVLISRQVIRITDLPAEAQEKLFARKSFREPVAGSEWLAADDAAVRAFLGDAQPDAAQDGFRQLDADLVRVIEDVVDVLISRQVIRITDLPAEAQEKLFARKSFRERLPARALRLFESDPGPDSGVIPTDFGRL